MQCLSLVYKHNLKGSPYQNTFSTLGDQEKPETMYSLLKRKHRAKTGKTVNHQKMKLTFLL